MVKQKKTNTFTLITSNFVRDQLKNLLNGFLVLGFAFVCVRACLRGLVCLSVCLSNCTTLIFLKCAKEFSFFSNAFKLLSDTPNGFSDRY